MKSVYKTHIEGIYYQKMGAEHLHEEAVEDTERRLFSEKHVVLLKELYRKQGIYERIASVSAPSM